jgi:hypothetical protein
MNVQYSYEIDLSKPQLALTLLGGGEPIVTFHGETAVSVLNELNIAFGDYGALGRRSVVKKYVDKVFTFGFDI